MSKFFGWFPSTAFENNTCIFVPNFANTCIFDTKEGLVIFDVPIRQLGQKTFDEVRSITNKPVKYIIYSHGHFDHLMDVPAISGSTGADVYCSSEAGTVLLDKGLKREKIKEV